MDITLRQATEADLNTVLDLVTELAVYERAPHAVTARLEDYISAFQEGLIGIILAVNGPEVLGMALYYDTFSTWKGKMLYLEDFYVRQNVRSRGVGAQIFEAVVQEARRRNCTMMKWQVLEWNTDAIRFYEKYDVRFDREWVDCKMYF